MKESSAARTSTGLGRWGARLGALVLLVVHGWLTLQLFGPIEETPLLSGAPVIAGRHALHLLHGRLGARAWREHTAVTTYDPTFHAGYPKTPWFDADSKPAELFLLLAHGRAADATAYKVGLAVSLFLLPLAGYTAAALLGLSHGVRCLALGLQMLLIWSDLGLDRLWVGDLAWMLGCAALVLALGFTTRVFTQPALRSWLGAAASLWLVIFLQPLFLLLLLPALLAFYLRVGWQRSWLWQVGLITLLALAVGGNGPWLLAMVRDWWVLAESPASTRTVTPPTWFDLWADVLRGGWLLGSLLLAIAAWGLHRLRRCLPTGGTRSWLVVLIEALVLAGAGPLLEGWFQIEALRGLYLALGVATLPAAVGLRQAVGWLGGRQVGLWGQAGRGLLATMLLAILLLVLPGADFLSVKRSWTRLPLGLPAEAQALVEHLRLATAPTARLLWEDDPATEAWSPLLPTLTERHFVGGLCRRRPIEHLHMVLGEGLLAGRPVFAWSNAELDRLVQTLNIGWLVVHSSSVLGRCAQWPLVKEVLPLPAGRKLVVLNRPHSYVLQGQARVTEFHGRRLTLVDLEPQDGVIVLSLHAHPLLRSTTNRVTLQRAAQLDDPVPLVRLHLPGPMSRLTIEWE